jgi:hypothetical protein
MSVRGDYQLALDEGLQLASSAAKKRLFWRNALINGAFIASWYVTRHLLS